ncbi:hypothetical protein GFB49_19355 [Epibacterium sp. SM1979]|uniref:Uncharacterized protein n=1 Tax=Tritonibacter litoralis TaxID=2662264 RepID=A0A843YHH0_9RHOB|nr:hypothetical protein [Tritonibacter litoralis]MQQ10616.1 hypothetical protein [Tritonibacter litoralis]
MANSISNFRAKCLKYDNGLAGIEPPKAPFRTSEYYKVISMYKNISNSLPKIDGDLTCYENPTAKASNAWYSPNREVVFVNGMLNSPKDHMDAALGLSLLQMCKVIGVYNASSVSEGTMNTVNAVVEDLVQCLGDKLQWDSHQIDRDLVKLQMMLEAGAGNKQKSKDLVRFWLARNKAALTLFDYLYVNKGKSTTIFAHSQGNLISSNALTGLFLLEPEALMNITVNSYGSPAIFWPDGISHSSYSYTLDPVALLPGLGNSLRFSTSTIGGQITHAYENYRRDDATFVVNAFRWGMLRMTASMDEEGLAKALVDMGTNMGRVTKIFERLQRAHYTDSDDVALLYIEKIKNNPALLQTVRNAAGLTKVLKTCLEEGWTTDRERKAIAAIS